MMSTLFSPILSPPQFIFFLDKFLQDIISGLPWVLNGSDLQPCQVYTSFYWRLFVLEECWEAQCIAQKQYLRQSLIQNGCSLLENQRPGDKTVKWDNSYVPPVVAASQSHERPTCTVLRTFLTPLHFLLHLSFADHSGLNHTTWRTSSWHLSATLAPLFSTMCLSWCICRPRYWEMSLVEWGK